MRPPSPTVHAGEGGLHAASLFEKKGWESRSGMRALMLAYPESHHADCVHPKRGGTAGTLLGPHAERPCPHACQSTGAPHARPIGAGPGPPMVGVMSRLTINLPAPPAKRHKFLQPVPVHQLQPAAAETDHFDELHHPVVSAPEAEAPEPALPNDTLLALQLLKSRFPAQVRHCVCMGGRRGSRLPPPCCLLPALPSPTHTPCFSHLRRQRRCRSPLVPSCTACCLTVPPLTDNWKSCGAPTLYACSNCLPAEMSTQSCSQLTTVQPCGGAKRRPSRSRGSKRGQVAQKLGKGQQQERGQETERSSRQRLLLLLLPLLRHQQRRQQKCLAGLPRGCCPPAQS